MMFNLFKKRKEYTAKNVPIIIPFFKRSCFLLRCLDYLSFAEGVENFTIYFCADLKRGKNITPIKECFAMCENWVISEKVIYERKKITEGIENSTGAIKYVLENNSIFNAFIYIEEDVIVGRNFLNFCLDSLNEYKDNPYVFGVSGFHKEKKYDNIVGMSPNIPSLIGLCGWRNRLRWSFKNLDQFISNNRFLQKELKNAKYGKECEPLKEELNKKGIPFNTAGGGLLLSNQLMDGRVSLIAKPALCDHIGWHGWHFDPPSGVRNSVLIPEIAKKDHIFARSFHPHNEYKLIETNKRLVSEYLQITSSQVKEPNKLKA